MTQSHQKYSNLGQQKPSSSATQNWETRTPASTATVNVSTAEAGLDAKPVPLPLTELSGVESVEEEVLLVVFDNVVLEEEGDGKV